jgi:hypothetical protein
VTMIPGHVWTNHQYRLPVSGKVVRSYLALRRAPIPADL